MSSNDMSTTPPDTSSTDAHYTDATYVEEPEATPLVTEPAAAMPVIRVQRLAKVYRLGQTRVLALRGVSLEIPRGEFVAITGPSGSGKSTFMNLLGCLDQPSGGAYWLNGKEVSRLASDQVATLRNRQIGFVFQGFNLLARATALANVALPLQYAGMARDARERRARRALRMVGLGDRLQHKPAQLSGGQQQRVAIARALVTGPAILLADEPTGNLDTHTSTEIMAILQQLNAVGLTIVLVTHEPDIAAYAQRQIAFRDGVVVRDEPIASRRFAVSELLDRADAPSGPTVRIWEDPL
jgi:putative ABC transport system ATP-binding protein